MLAMRDSDQPGGREQRSMDTVQILVADDHPLYRRGLRNLLSALPDIEVVGEARTGEEAVALAEQLQPDVIIMDLQMPGMSGIEATPHLLCRGATTFVAAAGSAGADRAGT